MQKRFKIGLWIAITIFVLPLIFLIGFVQLSWNDRNNIYDTPSPQEAEKIKFINDFIRGVDPKDVTSLSFAKTGGRESLYIAVATFTESGLAALRANSKEEMTGSFDKEEVSSLFGPSDMGSNLKAHVQWWDLKPSAIYESRSIESKEDRSATFYIVTNGFKVYIEAVRN